METNCPGGPVERLVGRLRVAATKLGRSDEWDDLRDDLHHAAAEIELPALADLPRGGIVGSVEIVDCVTHSASPWFMGRFGFVLRDPKPLPFVPYRGQLGFFDVPAEALDAQAE